jgi:hypothetical protein
MRHSVLATFLMRHILASPYSCHSTFLPLHILATPLFLPCYILAMSLFCRANVCRAVPHSCQVAIFSCHWFTSQMIFILFLDCPKKAMYNNNIAVEATIDLPKNSY